MNHQSDWNEEEDNFDLTLSQRTEELYRVPNMEPNADGLIEAVVLPLRDMVIFPRMVSPIFVGREASLLAVQEAQRKEQTVIGLTQKDSELDEPVATIKPALFPKNSSTSQTWLPCFTKCLVFSTTAWQKLAMSSCASVKGIAYSYSARELFRLLPLMVI